MLRKAPTDDAGTGRSILKSTISNYRYGNFDELFNDGLRTTNIDDANQMMRSLALNASSDPDEEECEELIEIAKKVMSMGPDLFNIKIHNRCITETLAHKGHVELSGMISSLQLMTTIKSQTIVESRNEEQIKVEEDALDLTFSGRGI